MSKIKNKILTALFLILIIVPLSSTDSGHFQKIKKGNQMEFKLFSSAFAEGAMIPVQYTCDGVNESPPLNWSGAPKETKTFVLIVDDPDAPRGDWVHWVLFNIPASTTSLKENASLSGNFTEGIVQGMNDFRTNYYGGPCPPSGTHRYFFKLYALNISLSLNDSANKKQLLEAMKGHILAEAHLIGKYKRTR
ncbi:MAG: YbhB/YbcL family Raf kinase inhibitor-like protein [Bacteroidetes bacterium]|nr:YbhB/YbcL family Raf kinase inhibitor-like protein [Bacteroidota bacterium]